MKKWQDNIEFFRRLNPEVAKAIEELPLPENYGVIYNDQGLPIITINDEPIHNIQDPWKEAADYFKRINPVNPCISIFLGLGNAYYLYYFLGQEPPCNRFTIIFEPDVFVFKLLMQTVDVRPFMARGDKTFLLLGKNVDNLFTEILPRLQQIDGRLFAKSIFVHEHPGLSKYECEDNALNLQIVLQTLIQDINSFGNDFTDGQIGLHNIIQNREQILKTPGIELIKNIFKDKPAVVVSAGPSLDKDIEKLKPLQDKVLICALDATLKKLLKAGIKPHVVFSLERVLLTVEFFKGLDPEQIKDIYLCSCPVVRPEMYEEWKGKNVIVYRHFAHFQKWFPVKREVLFIGASSANMAHKVAEYWGCNPIILIGQDLCYREDGFSHAEGIDVGTWKETDHIESPLLIPGNDGVQKRSNRTWLNFLKFFEKDIAEGTSKVINTTLTGAKIEGAEVMSFEEALQGLDLQPYDFLDRMNKELSHFEPKLIEANAVKNIMEGTKKDCHKLLIEFDHAMKAIDKSRKYFMEGELDYDKCENIYLKYYNRFKDLVNSPVFQSYIMHVSQSLFIRCLVEIFGISSKPYLSKEFKLVWKCYYLFQWYHYTKLIIEKLVAEVEV